MEVDERFKATCESGDAGIRQSSETDGSSSSDKSVCSPCEISAWYGEYCENQPWFSSMLRRMTWGKTWRRGIQPSTTRLLIAVGLEALKAHWKRTRGSRKGSTHCLVVTHSDKAPRDLVLLANLLGPPEEFALAQRADAVRPMFSHGVCLQSDLGGDAIGDKGVERVVAEKGEHLVDRLFLRSDMAAGERVCSQRTSKRSDRIISPGARDGETDRATQRRTTKARASWSARARSRVRVRQTQPETAEGSLRYA